MPDDTTLNGGTQEPNANGETPETATEEEQPVATVAGTFTKKGYCEGCFSVLTWDDPAVEKTIFGNKVVYCPECGAPVKVAGATIEEG